MNLRSDDKFVEDKGWHRAVERYENLLLTQKDQRMLFLELGVGLQHLGHHQISVLAVNGPGS